WKSTNGLTTEVGNLGSRIKQNLRAGLPDTEAEVSFLAMIEKSLVESVQRGEYVVSHENTATRLTTDFSHGSPVPADIIPCVERFGNATERPQVQGCEESVLKRRQGHTCTLVRAVRVQHSTTKGA